MRHIAAALHFLFGPNHRDGRVFTISRGIYLASGNGGTARRRPTPKIVDKLRQWQQMRLNLVFLLKGSITGSLAALFSGQPSAS